MVAEASDNWNLQCPEVSLNPRCSEPFAEVSLADTEFYSRAPVDLVLGADVYTQICRSTGLTMQRDGVTAMPTIFGYVLLGVSMAM